MILITSANDSIFLKVHKAENNGTVIYSSGNEWRKDEVGLYLEGIVNFTKSLRAKRVKIATPLAIPPPPFLTGSL